MNASADGLVWSAGIEYTWKNLLVSMDYFTGDLDIKSNTTDSQGLPLAITDTNAPSEQYYPSASYRFVDWFELGAYYFANYLNSGDKDGNHFCFYGSWINAITLKGTVFS